MERYSTLMDFGKTCPAVTLIGSSRFHQELPQNNQILGFESDLQKNSGQQ